MTEPVQEPQFQRALVIAAHEDDAEFMCASTVARWARQGKEITYVLATSGERGSSDPLMTPERLGAIRREEQREACRILGVRHLEFLGYPDQYVQNTLALRQDMARQIRRYRPDLVVVADPTQRWFSNVYLNHPDHRAVADAALDAVYPSARDYHAFPTLIAEGLMPHKTRYVLVQTTPDQANLWVDITDTLEVKLAALRAHFSQVEAEAMQIEEFVRGYGRMTAGEQGMAYAECFRLFDLER
ncbi:MAG: PIG-L family deacetylase [Dehalococcoidia bacterium]|nr:PIG-L family deacetylase [Dehalococcoidia bacterium]